MAITVSAYRSLLITTRHILIFLVNLWPHYLARSGRIQQLQWPFCTARTPFFTRSVFPELIYLVKGTRRLRTSAGVFSRILSRQSPKYSELGCRKRTDQLRCEVYECDERRISASIRHWAHVRRTLESGA